MRRSAIGLLAAGLATCTASASAASFPCAKARASDERAICADPVLGNLDSRLVALLDLDEDTVAMGQRGDMQDAQVAWLKSRAACGADRSCLRARYKARIVQVKDHLVERLCGKDGPPC